MRNALKHATLLLVFLLLWQINSIAGAGLVTIALAWIFFGFDRAVLGYVGFALLFAGIATSLIGIEIPTERLLNYGLFFLVTLVLLGFKEVKRVEQGASRRDQ